MSFIIAKHDKADIYSDSILLLIAGFYSIRLFLGYPFFGFDVFELTIWVACLLLIAGYLAALFIKEKN